LSSDTPETKGLHIRKVLGNTMRWRHREDAVVDTALESATLSNASNLQRRPV
jgi:hypothetical protein